MLKHFSPRSFRWTAILGSALGLAFLLGVWSLLPADLVKPRPNDRHVVSTITSLIRREHLSKHPLDDEISERGLNAFLSSLDPMKMYFQKSDADEFMKRKYDLDDMLMDKDISFAYTIFERFLTRVDARVKLINELLGREFDFDTQKTLVTDPKAIEYARDDQESQHAVGTGATDQVRSAGAQRRQDRRRSGPRKTAPPLYELCQTHAPNRRRRTAGDVHHVDLD
jgi:hypothetical protein